MKAKSMDMAWIVVSDLEKARKFFKSIGLIEKEYASEYKWVEFQGEEGGSMLGISEKNDYTPLPPGGNAIVTITVDNIVKAKEELSKKGVKIEGDIMEVPGHVKLLMFKDGDNNRFQLVETLD